MGIRRHLTYANVTATLALVLALGAGGAYAVDQIGSEDIRNDSILSEDLRDKRAVRGRDVARDSLGRREIDEATLVASRLVGLAGNERANCDPVTGARTDCAETVVRLRRSGRVIAIATGGVYGPENASAACEIRINGGDAPLGIAPGHTTSNTTDSATDGFATTRVSALLPPRAHSVTLSCEQLGVEDARIDTPTITAFALTGR